MSWRHHLQADLPAALPPRARAERLVRLDLNEGAFPPAPDERAAFIQAVSELELNRYPDNDARALRTALAKTWDVAPEEILVGNGSIDLVATLMVAFRRSGARLLLPAPTFDQFSALATLHGYQVVSTPLTADFQIDEDQTGRIIDGARPALAFFASPNNPTGNCFDPQVLERLAARLDGAFVVDEAYADYAGRSLLRRAPGRPGLFVLRSLSKLGLAGLRVGALVGERAAIAQIDRARLPFNVGALAQAVARTALSFPARIQARISATVAQRATLAQGLAGLPGVRVYPSQANFLLVRTPADATWICRRLLERGVAVRDVSRAPALAGCLRITVGAAWENRRCVAALAAALADRPGGEASSSPIPG